MAITSLKNVTKKNNLPSLRGEEICEVHRLLPVQADAFAPGTYGVNTGMADTATVDQSVLAVNSNHYS